MADAQTSSTPPASGNLSTVLMGIAALVAISGFGVLFSLWFSREPLDNAQMLRIASRQYLAGNPVVAGELAAEAKLSPDDDADIALRPTRDFLTGAGTAARAQQTVSARDKQRLLEEAIERLQAAAAAGFPPGRQADGSRILGQALFQLGRLDDAAAALRQAIQADRTLQRDLLPMLAEAEYQSPRITSDQALATIESYLGDQTLDPAQRREGTLIRIKTLLSLNRWQDADQWIESALKESQQDDQSQQTGLTNFRDQIRLLDVQSDIRRMIAQHGPRPTAGSENRQQHVAGLDPSLNALSSLTREATPAIAAKARLWAAKAYLCQGLPEQALAQLTMVRQQRPFGAEGVEGALAEIELLAEQGRGAECVQAIHYVVRELGGTNGYDASLVPFTEFKRRIIDSLAELRKQGQFESAIEMARQLPPVFEVPEALIQEGIAFREWAATTTDDATVAGGQPDRSASKLARVRYRAAGDAFAQAAKREFDTQRYLPTLLAAIEAYQLGRYFSRSIELLEPYLRYEQRRRQPRGLVAYGRALLAEGQPEQAIESLTQCVAEFPRDPMRYDARLLAAQAYAEIGDAQQAHRLLDDNLQDGELTPQSRAWRDSLLTLGEILYRKGAQNHLQSSAASGAERLDLLRENQSVLEDTLKTLSEAVERYWPDGRALDAAYLAARTHTMAALLPQLEAESPEILDTARRGLRARADREQQAALDRFVSIKQHLLGREDERTLAEDEAAMLRNCLIAEADVLRELSRLDEAETAYRDISVRYMNQPPALEAILGRARCLRQLGRIEEADLLIRQAGVVLQRIPPEFDDQFQTTTRYDREGWEKLITWMNDRVQPSGA